MTAEIPPESESNELLAQSRLSDDSSTSLAEEEEFPESKELTPELMEDECLRGDIMLRWALVLLAMLLGWTYVTESSLLVNIRSGQYMLSHGVLPPHADVFSATVTGRTWINNGWLSDLLLGGMERLLGMWSLTVLCALAVAAAFACFSRMNVPRVSTWWGSFCGFIALIAVFPILQPGTSTFALLAMAVLMLILSQESFLPANAENFGPIHRFSWNLPYIPVLFVLWTNVDPLAWAGLAMLLAFMLGDAITRRLHQQHQSHRDWGVVLVTCIVVSLVTPWPFQQFLNIGQWFRTQRALEIYAGGSELFPRLIYGMKDAPFWRSPDLYAIAAIILLGTSLITMLLNIRRLNFGWLGVWLVINAVALIDGRYVCYAAFVNAEIATLSGQAWYRSHYSMAYSIDTLSVLWSRAGRAVMVLSFFLVAYLAINGALMGSQGRRLGPGLDPRWANRIQSMQNDVVANSYSDRIFPTIPAQGDVLIWIGKKPFIDSRFELYLHGSENLLEIHHETRKSLFTPGTKEQPVESTAWKDTLKKFKITDLVVRLWGPSPPYDPLFRVIRNPAWVMTGLGDAGANFTRIDTADETLMKFVQQHAIGQFAKRAFRPEEKIKPVHLQGVWPLPVSYSDQWLIQKLQVTPVGAGLASHYSQILGSQDQGMTLEQVCGLAYLAIRNARQALAENPNQPGPYRVQMQAYRVLQQVENQVLQNSGVNLSSAGQYGTQILAAANAAVIASGEDVLDLERLLDIYLKERYLDLAMETLDRFKAGVDRLPSGLVDKSRLEQVDQLEKQLTDAVDQVKKQLDDARANGAVGAQRVGMALQGMCPRLALSILQEDLTELERSPELKLLYGSLLMKTGDFEQALQTLESMSPLMTGESPAPQLMGIATQWRSNTAQANLATQDVERAIELWDGEDQSFLRTALKAVLQMPFGAMALPVQQDFWAAFYSRMAMMAGVEVPERLGTLQMESARAELDAGKLQSATTRLQTLLKQYPQCSQRYLAAFYLGMLTGEPVQLPPASQLGPPIIKAYPKKVKAVDKPAQTPEAKADQDQASKNSEDAASKEKGTEDKRKETKDPATESNSEKEAKPAEQPAS